MRVLTKNEYNSSPCANDTLSIAFMNTDKNRNDCYDIQTFFQDTVPHFDKSVLETLFLRTFRHNSQHPSQKITVDESFMLDHGLEYFIKRVYIDKIAFIRDNVRIESVLHSNCYSSNVNELRLISYDFDTEQYSAYQCEDLKNIIDHFENAILHQLKSNEYDYNLTHSNNIPLLIGLENAKQIAQRTLQYNITYPIDSIIVHDCVNVFFEQLLNGIENGELVPDDTVDIQTITLEEKENTIDTVINEIRMINEQLDNLDFPKLNGEYVKLKHLQKIAIIVNGHAAINVTVLIAFVLSSVLQQNTEFIHFWKHVYERVNQNPIISVSNEIREFFANNDFRYVCISYDIYSRYYKGYLVHSKLEHTDGPDTNNFNTFLYTVLSQKNQYYMQKLTKKYGLHIHDVVGVIEKLKNRNSQTASEHRFMSEIPNVFEFGNIDYDSRCIVPCTDFLTL